MFPSRRQDALSIAIAVCSILSFAFPCPAQQGGLPKSAPLWMLEMEPIRKEIGLTESQQKELARIKADMVARNLALRAEVEAKIKALPPLPPAQDPPAEANPGGSAPPRPPVDPRTIEIREAYRPAYNKNADQYERATLKVLSPAQIRRIYQIEVQRMGVRIFQDPELARRLNYDEAKYLEIQQILQDNGLQSNPELAATMEAVARLTRPEQFGGEPLGRLSDRLKDDPDFRKRFDELTTRHYKLADAHTRSIEGKILRVLTAKQRRAYHDLVGEPFDRRLLSPFYNPPPASPTPAEPAAPSPKPTPTEPPKLKSLRERRGLPG